MGLLIYRGQGVLVLVRLGEWRELHIGAGAVAVDEDLLHLVCCVGCTLEQLRKVCVGHERQVVGRALADGTLPRRVLNAQLQEEAEIKALEVRAVLPAGRNCDARATG